MGHRGQGVAPPLDPVGRRTQRRALDGAANRASPTPVLDGVHAQGAGGSGGAYAVAAASASAAQPRSKHPPPTGVSAAHRRLPLRASA